MTKNKGNYTIEELNKFAKERLKERGVEIKDIAEVTLLIQKPYDKNLTLDMCIETIESVLRKREALYAVLTGIELDKLAEEGKLSEPLLSIVRNDYKLYGVDEIIPLSIINLYGSIGMANFGYLDKVKPCIIGDLDNTKRTVNTFLDDLIAGIAAAGASRLAHKQEK